MLCIIRLSYNDVTLERNKRGDFIREERWRERGVIDLSERAFPPVH